MLEKAALAESPGLAEDQVRAIVRDEVERALRRDGPQQRAMAARVAPGPESRGVLEQDKDAAAYTRNRRLPVSAGGRLRCGLGLTAAEDRYLAAASSRASCSWVSRSRSSASA
jgi:hypothetical protein